MTYRDHSNLLIYKDEQGKQHPVTTPADWAQRRAHILANIQLVTGPLPGDERKVPLDVRVESDEQLPHFMRRKISFAVEPGDRVPAYLLLPHERVAQSPALLCLHQTTSLGKAEPAGIDGKPNLHYAAHLAERGYIALAPDYPLICSPTCYGEYKTVPYDLGYASSTMKGIWNHRRAIDLLQAMPEVDAERIGCIGHSLGGHNTIFVAVFDERIKVAVSSCGFTAFTHDDPRDWSHPGYMPRIIENYQADPQQIPFDFPELIGALAPRPFFANATIEDDFDIEGVRLCMAAAQPVYKLFGAEEKLQAIYPPGGHDFPEAARQAAYDWIDRWL